MIILATSIILSLSNNGIIGKANEATIKTDLANAKQIAALSKIEWENGEAEGYDSIQDYIEAKLEEKGFSLGEKETASYHVSSKGELYRYPLIPEGFTASQVDTEDDIEEGLVIYNTTTPVTASTRSTAMKSYDQYVWVPVPEINDFIRRDGYYNGKKQTYVSSGEATEPFSKGALSETNDKTLEYAEYAKMKASVEKYGGFYIARYEAGTTNARTNSEGTSYKSDGVTPDVLSQKDRYPYAYVGWGKDMVNVSENVTDGTGLGAVELSRSIYPESANKEVVSTLIYGVQWDATMNFMKDVKNPNGIKSEYYIYDSTGMGWYGDNYGNATTGNKEYKTGIDVGTNAANMVKNVYDMAGNLHQWTMEAYSTKKRIIRSGIYTTGGSINPVSSRIYYDPYNAYGYVSFRVALYLK